jgi:hypothetical protein
MEFVVTIVKLKEHHLVLWLHTAVDPPQPDWDRAVQQLREYAKSKGVPSWELRNLVVSDGGAPNARQRRQLFDAAEGRPHMLAVVTTVLNNPIKRGVATALQWLNPSVRFYHPAAYAEALAYLGLEAEKREIWAEFKHLEAQLGPSKTLRLMPR